MTPQLAHQGKMNELDTLYERYVNQHYDASSIGEQLEITYKALKNDDSKKSKSKNQHETFNQFHHAYLQKEGILNHMINLLKGFQTRQNQVAKDTMDYKLKEL